MRKIGHLLLTACISLLATIGAALAENRIDTQLPGAPQLSAYGSYAVGVRTLELVNPNQIDILSINPAEPKPEAFPTYNRPLTVEVWYPAAAGSTGSDALEVFLRDGKTQVDIKGKARRDADPDTSGAAYPLVLISHGYPGNRFLLSHLAENLASKGYVVASIDHTDSTYRTQAVFGSTLVNRSLDQIFSLNELDRASKENGSFFQGLVDASNTALIGYSMGGYGAIITAGGGVTQTSVDYSWGGPHGTLGIHKSGSDSHNALPDPRIKTAIAFGPWGMNTGFWDKETLKGVKIPMFFIAGSIDDVSGYENGIRAIWEATTNVDRALLTYENANHNAGAPMPAPKEANRYDDELGSNIAEHYYDAVWDTARMNNIAQHFVTAWLGKHLKADASMAPFLDLVPNANDGIWAKDESGTNKPEHTHWHGFQNRTAKALRFEVLKPGE